MSNQCVKCKSKRTKAAKIEKKMIKKIIMLKEVGMKIKILLFLALMSNV